jgi:macrodomain Ter protein organizer (MatP/YcbG family)
MNSPSKRLTRLFKSPTDTKVAGDFLIHQVVHHLNWDNINVAQALPTLILARHDPIALREWCSDWLTGEQIQVLSQVVRFAANHRRVHKRTVLLSPYAHLLIKTLAKLEGLNMSEALEIHLERALREKHGMTVETRVNDNSGTVDYEVAPLNYSIQETQKEYA